MHPEDHWQKIYAKKAPDQVSWYRPHLERSLEFIRICGLNAAAHIVDVGGGASTLVDDLLSAGYSHLTVIDLAQSALDVARAAGTRRRGGALGRR